MNSNNIRVPILGKIIGGIIGLLLFNIPGLILGIIIGHIFDRRAVNFMPGNKQDQAIYIDNLFAVLGYMAKLDGQVSKREINYASMVINRLHLSAKQREQVMKAFYRGKREDFNLDLALDNIKRSTHQQTKLLYFFLNTQVQMAYADGVVKNQLKPVLQRMAQKLGLAPLNFAYYDAIFGWQQRWQYHQQQQQAGGQYYQQAGGPRRHFGTSVEAAYKILGISSKASDAEVKKTYRKMMSKYHPDKLMSQGLSEAEMQAATEKVQQIKAAYEQIREARGI